MDVAFGVDRIAAGEIDLSAVSDVSAVKSQELV
jgi:hypothetical protein